MKIFISCILLLFVSLIVIGDDKMNSTVIPVPLSVRKLPGSCTLSDKVAIVVPENADVKAAVQAFITRSRRQTGLKFFISSDSGIKKNCIMLSLTPNGNDKDESYTLKIPKTGAVTIESGSYRGLFYGLQTLLQMIPPDPSQNKVKIPCAVVKDAPRFKWRGFMVDCSRHFFTVKELKKLIDEAAAHKMNIFHWHLVDDPAWRLEIKKYPQLTQLGAKRNGSKTSKKGFFYTQDDARDIVAYAKARGVTVIPEIEMPGHSGMVLSIMKQLKCNPDKWQNVYCAGKDETFKFLEDVLTEVFEIFPSKYVHIGGDEANKSPWKTCPDCRKRMKEENLEDVNALQSWFIKRVEKIFQKHNRYLLGWDEIIEGGLAPSAAIMHWRTGAGGMVEHAAEEGHNVIMTPQGFCYFDYHQDGNWYNEPPGWNGTITLEKAYSYEPVPASLPEDKQKFVLGGQANVWSERVATPEHLEYMLFPRGIALSEVFWSSPEKKDYKSFTKRLVADLKRLKLNSVHPRYPDGIIFKPSQNGLVLKPEMPGAAIHYTVDSSKPTLASPVYKSALKIKKPAIVKAVEVKSDGTPGRVKEYLYADYVSGRIKVSSTVGSPKRNPPQRMLDQSLWTIWRSEKIKKYPVDLIFDFGKTNELQGVVYDPKTDGRPAGMVTEYEISISDNKNSFPAPVVKGTLKAKREKQYIFFNTPCKGRYLRFRIKKSNRGFAAIAGLKFFR